MQLNQHHLLGEDVREGLRKEIYQSHNMFPVMCRMVLFIVQISRIQKLYEEQKEKLQQSTLELAAFRTYAHAVKEDWEDFPRDTAGRIASWKDKLVLVMGGP